jgi:membrane carboxypeptidase/penicillin-binding protein PbpC
LALGGGEVTLLELTNAYAGLARGGVFRACRFATPADEASARVQASVRPFAAGSVTLVREMLGVRPLPGSPGLNLAWKTGTSTGFRDAWCVAFNSDFTIGVWIGHQGGRPDPDLVGIRVATPVVASIANSLYSGPRLLPPPPAREGVVRVALCAETGLRAMPCCGATRWGDGVAGVPLRGCMPARHRSEPGMIGSTRGPSRAAHSGVRIRSPVPRAYLAEDEAVRLELAAVSAAEYVWYVDGAVVGRSRGPLWHEFPRGRHEVCCLAASSGATDRVTLLVR